MSILLKLICGIGIAISLTACSSQPEKAEAPPEPVVKEPAPQPKEKSIGEQIFEAAEEPSDFLSSGEDGYLSDDVMMGVGEDIANLEEVVSYASANNKAELAAMIDDGRALIVEKGTPITLIDTELGTGKVKITETGTIGWVPEEYLSKTMPE